MTDFRPAIRRALQAPCTFDFLIGYRLEPRSNKCTRPAFARIMTMLDLARAGLLGNCNDLAKRFGVTTKTALRDIAFLRREFALPIAFNKLTNAYELTAKAAESLHEQAQARFTLDFTTQGGGK